MKRSFYFLISFAALMMSAVGCVKDIQVEAVRVEPETLTLAPGETFSLTVTVQPEDADYVLDFSSNNEDVATVSAEGEIAAVAEGEAVITVKAGNFSATCTVTVLTPILEVSPSVEELVFEGVRTRTQEFAVTTTATEWTAEPDADWLSVEYTEGGFVLNASANLSTEVGREGTVTVSAEGYEPVSIPVRQAEMKMYIAGNDNSTACYWLNGEKVTVGPENGSFVQGIAIESDGTVHCVGREGIGQSYAAYWSEELGWNMFQPYDKCQGNAVGVAVDEGTGDVYFSAYYYFFNPDYTQTTVSGYHKNLIWNPLTPEDQGASQVGDIVFQDGSLYLLLNEGNVWYYTVNGDRYELDYLGEGNYPSSMFVKDGDVYVGGWYLTQDGGEYIYAPCYWKNGEGVELALEYGCPYDICVDEEDNVWLAGAKGPGLDRCAAYWKNNEPSVDVSSYANGCAVSIDVIDGNIIIAGFEGAYPSNSVLKYWINGEETAISDGSTSCAGEATVII